MLKVSLAAECIQGESASKHVEKKKGNLIYFLVMESRKIITEKAVLKKLDEFKFSPGFIIADLRPRFAGDRSSSEARSFLFPDSEVGGTRGLSCPLRVGVVLLLEVLGEPRLPRRFLFPSTRLSAIQHTGISHGLSPNSTSFHLTYLYRSGRTQ